MEKLRDVSQEEIHRAAQRWARQQRSNPNAHSYDNSASFFIYAAKKWLCFHGRLKPSSAPRTRFADQLGDFALYMNRRTRAVSAVRPITLLEDVEVPELGWGAASIVGAGERRRRGRVSCDERRGRMESQVRFCGRAGAAGFLPVGARRAAGALQASPRASKHHLSIRGPARRSRERGATARAIGERLRSGSAADTSPMQRQMVSWTQLSYCT